MLVKVRRGAFDVERGDLEPNGEELWAWEDAELSGAALTAAGATLELGTWYTVNEFERLLSEVHIERGVVSAISVRQPGVAKAWITSIEVDEGHAVMMICRSVLDHARSVTNGGDCWVRVE